MPRVKACPRRGCASDGPGLNDQDLREAAEFGRMRTWDWRVLGSTRPVHLRARSGTLQDRLGYGGTGALAMTATRGHDMTRYDVMINGTGGGA